MANRKGYFRVSVSLQQFRTSTPERDNGRSSIADTRDLTRQVRHGPVVERVDLDSKWRTSLFCGKDIQGSKLYQSLTSPFQLTLNQSSQKPWAA
jgi:hypothetical protein